MREQKREQKENKREHLLNTGLNEKGRAKITLFRRKDRQGLYRGVPQAFFI
jgi:hypothetical protein